MLKKFPPDKTNVVKDTPYFLSRALTLHIFAFNPLNANPTKWLNTIKQFVVNLPANCLSVFDHFVGLAFKGLKI